MKSDEWTSGMQWPVATMLSMLHVRTPSSGTACDVKLGDIEDRHIILRRSIERDSEDLIRIGFDGRLFLIGRTAVRATAAFAASSDSPPPPANERLIDLTEEDVAIDAADVDCAAGRLAAAVCREDDGNGESEDRSEGKLYRVTLVV